MSQKLGNHTTIEIGRYGEQLGVEALTEHGYQVLERNFRCQDGEADVIAFYQGCLVGVEIKTHHGHGFGDPLAALSATQLRRIQRTVLVWKHQNLRQWGRKPIRVDLLALTITDDGDVRADLLEDVSR